MTDDQAANRFLQTLREKPLDESHRETVVDISAHVTINRPVRCTFVIGGQHFGPKKETGPGKNS